MVSTLFCVAALLCSFVMVNGQFCQKRTSVQIMRNLAELNELFVGAANCIPGRENIALGKRAYQTSVGWGGHPGRAVDGNMLPHWNHKSCTHTKKQRNPYWYVYLGRHYMVETVIIQNRGDCCANRLNNVQVTVGDNPRGRMAVCGSLKRAVRPGEVIEFKCRRPIKGKFVRVQILTTNYLTLCEVQVYGSPAR